MDAATFRSVHRYGLALSVVAIVLGIPTYVVGGALRPAVLALWSLGPLGGFYFGGAVLERAPRHRVLGEELLRGVVWYGASLFGWSLVLTSSSVLPTTPLTVLGLPAVTALGLSLAMTGLRRTTGHDFRTRTGRGQLLVFLVGAVGGGFAVLYAVLVNDHHPALVLLYGLAALAGSLLWRRHRLRADV